MIMKRALFLGMAVGVFCAFALVPLGATAFTLARHDPDAWGNLGLYWFELAFAPIIGGIGIIAGAPLGAICGAFVEQYVRARPRSHSENVRGARLVVAVVVGAVFVFLGFAVVSSANDAHDRWLPPLLGWVVVPGVVTMAASVYASRWLIPPSRDESSEPALVS
jgi:ABC-type branched-subunit amino acid transport system permease subunit